MSKTISIMNKKGGVGKTATTVECAFQLAKEQSVLVVDLDGQANATQHITGQLPTKGIYDLLIDPKLSWQDLLVDAVGDWGRVAVLPATRALDTLERAIDQDRLQRELMLDEVLAPIRPYFDYILIDNPPAMDLRAINSLCASDYYMIPTDSSEYAMDGIRSIQRYADRIADRLNPKLQLLAVLVTAYDKGNSHAVRAVLEELKDLAPQRFWGTIPNSVRVLEAQKRHTSVQAIEPDSKVAQQYRDLVKHIKEFTNG